MSYKQDLIDEIIQTDILVIGGGIAGCMAAIRARDTGADVILVEKANVGRCGISHQMNGVLTYFQPQKDSALDWYKECVEAGQGLSDLNRLHGMVEETSYRISEMEQWGVKFQKEKGEILRKPGFGQIQARNAVLACGGFQLMSVIRGEVLRRGVRLVERVMISDLLTSDGLRPTRGSVAGAIGFGIRNGRFHIIRSKAVVLTAGAARNLLSSVPTISLTDDGKAMAFRVGAELRNLELSMIGPTAAHFGVLGANILLGEGAILINARGERFMPVWDPLRQERAPRSVMGRAIASEERNGRGPVYLDATNLDEMAHRRIEKAIPEVVAVLSKGNLELRKDRIQWTTEISGLGPGGIRVDRNGLTSVTGLFAAGACSDHGEDGVINVITHGMESIIGGDRAGRAAASYVSETGDIEIDKEQVNGSKSSIFDPLKRDSDIDYSKARKLAGIIKEEGLLGPVRNEKGLRRAIALSQEIQAKFTDLKASDFHDLARIHGIKNEIIIIEMMARCALFRTESRGSHYREDYPERDDKNWLKWVMASRCNDKIDVYIERVPDGNIERKTA